MKPVFFSALFFAFFCGNYSLATETETNYEIAGSPAVVEVAKGHSLQLLCRIKPKITSSVIWARMPKKRENNKRGRGGNQRPRTVRRGETYFRSRVSAQDAGIYRCMVYARERGNRKLIKLEKFFEVRVVKCDVVNSLPCKVYKGVYPHVGCAVLSWHCDGTDDCGNQYDESKCSKRNVLMPMCKGTEVRCYGAGKCIPKAYECDKEEDCRVDNIVEDEKYCRPPTFIHSAAENNVPIVLQVGDKLTLNCSADAKPKPMLHWRFNAKAMHPQAIINQHVDEIDVDTAENNIVRGYTVGSSLVIYKVSRAHSGFYSCEAIHRNNRAFFDYHVTVVDTKRV